MGHVHGCGVSRVVKCRLFVTGLFALWLPVEASAQSINREQMRYELRQRDCREAYRVRVEGSCDVRCQAAAATRRDRCLSAAEQRYTRALRTQIRARDLPY